VTGASDGIGAAAARRLAADGHKVIVVGRSPDKTAAVAHELGTDFHLVDFAKLSQVSTLADVLLEKYSRIDVLVNNAGGVFGKKREVTQDGHEITFQVNYLAGFLLTMRLMPRLLESRATVIFTSSLANSGGRVDLEDLENEKRYSARNAYSDSKLEQIVLARELNRRYGQSGLAPVVFHPGLIASNFSSEKGSAFRIIYRSPLRNLLMASSEKGADTLVFLAEGEPGVDFRPGEYYRKRKVAKPNSQADDPELARGLWQRSEVMVSPFHPMISGV
jgi:NAD(P)-dependent dehydrogenase (short-subunit alcohol dehydrogenase family)